MQNGGIRVYGLRFYLPPRWRLGLFRGLMAQGNRPRLTAGGTYRDIVIFQIITDRGCPGRGGRGEGWRLGPMARGAGSGIFVVD